MAFNFGSSFGFNTGSGFGFGTTSTAPTTTGFGTTSAPATTGFGFGTTTPATTSSFGTSLFGSSTSTPSTSLFGSTTSSTTSNPFGLTTAGFGAPAASAGFGTLSTTSAPTTSTFVTSSTPFTELPQNYRDLMIHMETLLRTTSNARDEIREHNKTVRGKREIDITAVMEKLSTLSLAIERDTHSLTSFREDVRKELSSAEIATRHLSRLQPHTVTGTTTTSNVSLHENIYLPSPYHWNKLDEFHQRMSTLAHSIREIDEYMSSMEHQTYNEPQSLPNVLRSQYDVLMILTARVATLHQSIEELRQKYKEIYGDDIAIRMFRRIPMHTLEIPMGNAQQTLFGGSGSLAGIGMTPGATTTGTSTGYTLPPATNPATGLTGNTSSTLSSGFNFGTTTPAPSTSTSSLFGTTTPATTTTTAGTTGGNLFGGSTGFGTTSFDTNTSFATPTTFSRTQSTSAMNKARGRSTGGRR